MAKSFLMGDGEITPQERENLKEFTETQENQMKEMTAKQIEADQKRLSVTLEQLLKTRFDPHEDRVVVWPDAVESITSGGIIKSAETIKKEEAEVRMGTVLAVGPGKKVEETVTNYLLLALLATTPISVENMEKVKAEVNKYNDIPLEPGDRIIYGKFAGTPIPDPDTKAELLIMRPGDIFGKIKA